MISPSIFSQCAPFHLATNHSQGSPDKNSTKYHLFFFFIMFRFIYPFNYKWTIIRGATYRHINIEQVQASVVISSEPETSEHHEMQLSSWFG